MTPPSRASSSAPIGMALVLWLVVSFVLTWWLVERGWDYVVVTPRCEETCMAIGQHRSGLHVGGRGRGPTACLCDGGASVETSAPDVGAGLGVALGLGVAYGSVWLIARRRSG